MFMELHREEKEEGDRGDQEEKGGNQKERDRSSQKSVPEVFSIAKKTQRFTEFGREEKQEGGD